MIATQRINNKIHHPEDEGGGHGDVSDALAGSVSTLVAQQITARPPAKNVAAIISAVNRGTAKRPNPMSSSNTIRNTTTNTQHRTRFPKLR